MPETASLGASTRELTGRVSASAVHRTPRLLDPAVVEGFRALGDLSSTVSDVLDELGLAGAIGSSALRPTVEGARAVGAAVTVRNRPRREPVAVNRALRDARMEELEGINQADIGDVLVIEGVARVSNMGGMMASIAVRQGLAGAVVEGGVRDVAHSRSIGYPVWSSEVTPITGKWRAETVEVNGPVAIAGVPVHAGDLVIADDTGVCFVRPDLAASVLERCRSIADRERRYLGDIDAGMPIPELSRHYKPKVDQAGGM